jgi:hypothetical protein
VLSFGVHHRVAAMSLTPLWIVSTHGAWHLVEWRHDGTTLGIRVDGGTELTEARGAVSYSGSSTHGIWANNGSGTGESVLRFAEIRWWNTPQSAAIRTAHRRALAAKWGLTLAA